MKNTVKFIKKFERNKKIELLLITNKWKIMLFMFFLFMSLAVMDMVFGGYISSRNSSLETSSLTMDYYDFFKTFIVYFSGSTVIFPLYLTSISIIEKNHNSRIENTNQIIQKWDDDSLLTARDFTRDLGVVYDKLMNSFVNAVNGNLDNNDKISFPKAQNSNDLKRSAILVLNFMDGIRVSIKNNRVDLFMLNDSLGEVIIKISIRWQKYAESLSDKSAKDLLELRRYFECLTCDS